MKRFARSEVFACCLMIAGLVCCAAGYRMFLVPNDIAAGGFTGAAQLVHAGTGLPVGWVALAMNVPLFAVSLRSMGLRFGLKSLIASILLSLFIDYLPIPQATDDPLLGALFGGVAAGAGFGLILRAGATTGGSDMLARLIVRRLPVFKIGVVTFLIDAIVITASAFVFDTARALWALVSAYAMNAVMDTVYEGPNLAKCYYIISESNDVIARRILTEMNRGATELSARGMYSGRERPVLLCVVSRLESLKLRQIVAETDPKAFMIATNVHEALGEGFQQHGGT
ncbi:MAG: YitT family protein [Clostridia bacterium]|nr:YitT family protein [Clostridia bacterium]